MAVCFIVFQSANAYAKTAKEIDVSVNVVLENFHTFFFWDARLLAKDIDQALPKPLPVFWFDQLCFFQVSVQTFLCVIPEQILEVLNDGHACHDSELIHL